MKRQRINLVINILVAMIAGALIAQFVTENIVVKATVEGSSMENTLYENDIVLINKLGKVKRNSIVVVKEPPLNDKYIIKRCLALPGDTIYCKGSLIYVNNKVVEDNWSKGKTEDFNKILLHEDEYFVLGDNREVSKDSRVFGPVSKSEIVGIVIR